MIITARRKKWEKSFAGKSTTKARRTRRKQVGGSMSCATCALAKIFKAGASRSRVAILRVLRGSFEFSGLSGCSTGWNPPRPSASLRGEADDFHRSTGRSCSISRSARVTLPHGATAARRVERAGTRFGAGVRGAGDSGTSERGYVSQTWRSLAAVWAHGLCGTGRGLPPTDDGDDGFARYPGYCDDIADHASGRGVRAESTADRL